MANKQNRKRMEQKILEYISKYVPLTEEEKKSILQEVPFKTFKKGTHILRQGQISVSYTHLTLPTKRIV